MAELIWKGKYDKDGKRAAPKRTGRLLNTTAVVGATEGANRLILGDKTDVLPALLGGFSEKVDLIYLDPPFATGSNFFSGDKLAYRDAWNDEDEYLQWLYETLVLARDLLTPTGSLYLHLAHHMGQYAKILLDEVFGRECFQNEIIWHYRTGGASKRRFARKHDNIFFYTRSPDEWTFHPQKQRSYMMHHYGFRKSDFEVDSVSGVQFSLVYARDVWTIPSVGSATGERVGYPTQKPEQLLERIIRSSSNPGDLVLDCFCGSGTTGVVAGGLGRRWLMSDVSPLAIEKAQNRLLKMEPKPSFLMQKIVQT